MLLGKLKETKQLNLLKCYIHFFIHPIISSRCNNGKRNLWTEARFTSKTTKVMKSFQNFKIKTIYPSSSNDQIYL